MAGEQGGQEARSRRVPHDALRTMRPAESSPLLALALLCTTLALPRTQEPPLESADLAQRIEAVRARAGVPAMGAALVTRDGLAGVWVAGTRCAGDAEPAGQDDLWHLGSCTKAMTSTLLALLVTRGDLAWDGLLGDLLPDLAERMHPDFVDVTLRELLGHRAGVTNQLSRAFRDDFAGLEHLPMVAQRERVVLDALGQAPVHPPHGKFLYSNLGYIVAGHVAEVVTGKSWEELIASLLFEPLGMPSAGFGAPGTPGQRDQPRGHTDAGLAVEPGADADNPAMLGPAGTVRASLGDWARFARVHLRGAVEDVKIGELTLTRDTFALLHRPCEGPEPRYALGWGLETRAWAGGDGTTLEHNGSNALWYCSAWLGLPDGVGVLVTANQASPAAKGAVNEVARLLTQELERRARAR
jgi:CubicO group peptidase (beta-lactamase class C family)